MNINRHNYEEFFLLYVDKELSAADRKTVEVFVKENPDLQIELALLQQTVLPADDMVLQKKDWLYMEENISALQENILLYADNELNGIDKMAVESLLNKNSQAKAEFALLQQTKLQPDKSVVFEDKTLLYRTEEGMVVGFTWWRVAAAAVLLGLGLWTGVSVYKNNSQKRDGSEMAVKENNIKTQQQKSRAAVDTNQAINNNENTNAENNTAITNQQDDTQRNEKTATPSNKLNKADKQSNTAYNQTLTQQSPNSKKPDNNLPKPYFEKINNKPGNKITVANVQSENNSNVRVSGSNDAVASLNAKENTAVAADPDNRATNTNLTAIQVVNTNTDGDGENNARYLNIDNSKGKRSALGGLIRKAKRVLERTTNVKTGEGIKIAGFEIALK